MNRDSLHRNPHSELGFTLIELLVVIAILALIASFAAPRVFNALSGAESDTAKVQIEALGTAIDLYRLEVGSYPSTLDALIEQPAGTDKWNGPYLKKSIPKDPWGNDYRYNIPGRNGPYDLLSYGADGVAGGDGSNRDIVSWE